MKKDQLADSTIEVIGRRLRLMAKSVDLDKPDAVTEYLAKKEGKNSYIESLANAYYRYAKYNGIFWKQPIIKRSSQPPYIPTTEEITALVSDAGKKYSLILNVLKDTGMRPIEIERTKLKWLNLNRGTINVETAKHARAWSAFNSLERKKLIWKADVKEYRNREYPLYWLTDEGIIIAMLEGIEPAFLLDQSKKFYPDAKLLHCFLEAIQHMNPKVIQLARNIVKNKGNIEFVDLMTILVSDATFEDVETMQKIVAVLKNYPEEYAKAKILIENMIEKLRQLIYD
jgi:integrase